MTVTITEEGLASDGKHIPVYSGSVHYWRLDRVIWPLILDQIQSLGFAMIETYIPWSVHEIAPGTFDWGTIDPRKDVEAFCQLCEARGIYLIVRPGPLINAEMTDFGFPEWVLLDPEVQARTAVGSIHLDAAYSFHPPRPFPVPSYTSPTFYAAVGEWFDAVCPIIARHLAPSGCIVAVQSDNESCYLFQEQAYATDYAPSSIAAYRQFLSERYGTIDALNAVYATQHQQFTAIDPPRDCQIHERSDVPWHRDWVEYKERYIIESVSQVARMLRERGIQGVPIFHDVAFQYRTPLDIARMEADPAIDWVGMNLYRSPQEYESITKRMRYLAGTTRLPFVPELGCGIWSHHPQTPTPAEQEFVTLTALMHGMRAFNFYMLVERERWQGSPITRHGTYRKEYAGFFRRLATFLQQHPLGYYKRRPQVMVLHNYDLDRYAAMASTLHYAHVDLLRLPEELGIVDLDLGFRYDVAHEANHHRSDNWLGTALRTLKRLQLDYDVADSHVAPTRLQHYPIVCLPSVDFMDAPDQRMLMDYTNASGHLILGPGVPYLDSYLHPYVGLNAVAQQLGEALCGKGRITWASTAELGTVLAQALPTPTIRWDAPEIEVIEQVWNAQCLLFVANPNDRDSEVTISFETPRHLSPCWADVTNTIRGTQLTLTLAPYSVQIWETRDD